MLVFMNVATTKQKTMREESFLEYMRKTKFFITMSQKCLEVPANVKSWFVDMNKGL